MNYLEQLNTDNWSEKRLEILKRDNYECQSCGKRRPSLIGLNSTFGFKTIKELSVSNYSLFPIDSLTYDNIFIHKDSFVNAVIYIGDKTRPFCLDDLLFSIQHFLESDSLFGLKRGVRYLCVYKDSITVQDFIDLNIHHKFYIEGNLAWDYDDDALITLCIDCHQAIHKAQDIIVYNKTGDTLYKANVCDKCDGSGYLKEYDYWKNGICFRCMGEGVIIKN